MKLSTTILSMFAALALSTGTAHAGDVTPEEAGRVVKVPETAAGHEALARYYDQKATEWQKEADYHRGMAAAYKKAHGDTKDSEVMARHCAKLSKDATEMMKEARTMADYHRMRAKESR